MSYTFFNASNNGLDSRDGHNYHPKEGVDGHVVLARTGVWYDDGGNECRSSVLFHELAENYYRTDGGIPYRNTVDNAGNIVLGAHQKAINFEGGSYGNRNPGGFKTGAFSKAAYYYQNNRVW